MRRVHGDGRVGIGMVAIGMGLLTVGGVVGCRKTPEGAFAAALAGGDRSLRDKAPALAVDRYRRAQELAAAGPGVFDARKLDLARSECSRKAREALRIGSLMAGLDPRLASQFLGEAQRLGSPAYGDDERVVSGASTLLRQLRAGAIRRVHSRLAPTMNQWEAASLSDELATHSTIVSHSEDMDVNDRSGTIWLLWKMKAAADEIKTSPYLNGRTASLAIRLVDDGHLLFPSETTPPPSARAIRAPYRPDAAVVARATSPGTVRSPGIPVRVSNPPDRDDDPMADLALR
jgi:hypothetical protein